MAERQQNAGLYGQEDVTGSASGSPNSGGWIFELDYLPFINKSPIEIWPWTQVKLALQYTLYDKFNGASRNYDGSGRDASEIIRCCCWGGWRLSRPPGVK